MSTNAQFACFFNTPKSEGQKDGELLDYKHRMEEISNLPLYKEWKNNVIRLYQGFWFPEPLLAGMLSLRQHLRTAPSDIFLDTFPKSGSIWLKALVFSICKRNSSQNSSSNGYLQLLTHSHHNYSPFLEALFSGPVVPDLNVLPSPRQLSTHIPYSLLPKSVRDPHSHVRIIYMCREPKDTFVSTYHFINEMRLNQKYVEPLPIAEAVELFCKGLSSYGPVWEHQLEYWRESQRRPDKVLFLKYEDMKAEPEASVRMIAKFLGMPFSKEEESRMMVAEIVELCSFEKLSGLDVNKVGVFSITNDLIIKNSSFFRKGKVGDWREHLTLEMAEKVDVVTRDKLHDTGLIHQPTLAGNSDQVEEM